MLKIDGQDRDPILPPLTAYGMFLVSCWKHWDDVVVDEDTLRITRREMKEDIDTLAWFLKEVGGVREGHIVTVASGRSMYATLIVFFAANRIGATTAIIDERVTRETLMSYLDEFGSRVVFTYEWSDQEILEARREGAFTRLIINMKTPYASPTSFLGTFLANNRRHASVADYARLYRPSDYFGHPLIFRPQQEALISFTSGSTSGPKPMVFTNQNLLAEAIFGKVASGVKMWDKNVHTWMPYVHFDCPYGFVVSTLAPLFGGGELILTPNIYEGPQKINYYLRKNPNVIFGTPVLLKEIPEVLEDDVSLSHLMLFTSGGERLEAEVSREAVGFFKKRGLNVRMSNGYGAGEALGLISTAIGNIVYNPDTVGVIPAGVHVMVRDRETGRELGFNEPGIICVAGKHILKRYYNRPKLNDQKIIMYNGVRFVETGDLGFVTRDGRITLTGRADFFLNRRSVKVYYEIVREAISRSRLVKKCFVVKGPDPELGVAPYAFVIREDIDLPEEQARREIAEDATKPFYLGERLQTLEADARPRKIIFVDEFPLTAADKVNFHHLEEMAQEIGAREAAQAQAQAPTQTGAFAGQINPGA